VTSPRTLSPTQAKARNLLWHSGIPYQTGKEADYLLAVAYILAQEWPSRRDEGEAVGECSHWVGR